jgi:hypothetical protein
LALVQTVEEKSEISTLFTLIKDALLRTGAGLAQDMQRKLSCHGMYRVMAECLSGF